MRILFVTTEHPGYLYGGLGTFTREYVRELRKHADVKCVYFHLQDAPLPQPDLTVDYVIAPEHIFEAFSPEARILEVASSFRSQLEPILKSFRPDVIHCNDRQTFLPFRFEKNVFYSSHLIFTDLLTSNTLNDLYFQEVKVERCALENSSIVAAYSDFSAKSVLKVAGGRCTPVVLPLGLNVEKFYSNKRKNRKDGILNVSYFGRFEDVQKGVNDFILAVNQLGPKFKQRNKVRFHLYGKGFIDPGLNLDLFEKPQFLEGNDLYEAYADSDIVVMPSRYEPFGLTGLEAMASGSLLLVAPGLGMDMYAEPGRNCLTIPNNSFEMSKILRDAILDYDKYSLLQDNAVATAKEWTWERCVKSHMYIYRQICAQRIPQLASAYRIEEREVLDSYKKSNDVEKIHCAEMERISSSCVLDAIKNEIPGKRILVVTGNYEPEDISFGKNVKFVSVLNDSQEGIPVRMECLPFRNNQFDEIIVAGGWESVLDPCGALMELERVAKDSVLILYKKGQPYSWQTFQMEREKDWKIINSSKWICDFNNHIVMEKTVPYGAVFYKYSGNNQEVLSENFA
ncbi:MAG: glycosyltransferase family 4 protein [Treponema sp.]|nr:glycosyltransferase family 4 protein [Treponema sp.]